MSIREPNFGNAYNFAFLASIVNSLAAALFLLMFMVGSLKNKFFIYYFQGTFIEIS